MDNYEHVELLYDLKERIELACADHPGDDNLEECDRMLATILEEID